MSLPAASPDEARAQLLSEVAQLTQQLALQPDSAEELLIRRGGLYWRLQDIPRCLADYDAALRLNPQSRARHLRRMVDNVLNYYYKDLYNP